MIAGAFDSALSVKVTESLGGDRREIDLLSEEQPQILVNFLKGASESSVDFSKLSFSGNSMSAEGLSEILEDLPKIGKSFFKDPQIQQFFKSALIPVT